MAAAWPYCDAVVSAHNFEALDDLLEALRAPAVHRPPIVPAEPAPAAVAPAAARVWPASDVAADHRVVVQALVCAAVTGDLTGKHRFYIDVVVIVCR